MPMLCAVTFVCEMIWQVTAVVCHEINAAGTQRQPSYIMLAAWLMTLKAMTIFVLWKFFLKLLKSLNHNIPESHVHVCVLLLPVFFFFRGQRCNETGLFRLIDSWEDISIAIAWGTWSDMIWTTDYNSIILHVHHVACVLKFSVIFKKYEKITNKSRLWITIRYFHSIIWSENSTVSEKE